MLIDEEDEKLFQVWKNRLNQSPIFPISENDKKEVRRVNEKYSLYLKLNRNCSNCYRDAIIEIIYNMKKEKNTEISETVETPEISETPKKRGILIVNTEKVKSGRIGVSYNGKPLFVSNDKKDEKHFRFVEDVQDEIKEAIKALKVYAQYFTEI